MKSMTMDVKFKNLDTLMEFLNSSSEFKDWETVIFRITTSAGMELNINTKVHDPFGKRYYTELKSLLLLLNDFYRQHKYLSLNLEIKLKVPIDLKTSMDPKGNCEALYLDFYSDCMNHVMIPSYVEKEKEYDSEVVINWVTYALGIYNSWYTKKQLNG